MRRARVLVADDHKIVAEGLRSLLEPEFDLVGIVMDGRALVKMADKLSPDVIVADISMPVLNGIEAAQQIKKAGSKAKIIFLTMHPDVTYASRALEAGASGFVLKHSATAELVMAIRKALNGRTYVTPMIAEKLEHEPLTSQEHPRKLTPRQREVLQLLTEGHSAKQIADILNISFRTVEFHKYRIMEELGISSSAELVRYAIKHGIVFI